MLEAILHFDLAVQVYKGTQLTSENTLIDMPTGVITFHMDTTDPQLPGENSCNIPSLWTTK